MSKKCNALTRDLIQNKVQEIYQATSTDIKYATNDLWDGYSGVYLFQNHFNKINQLSNKNFDHNNLILDKDNFGLGFSGQMWSNIFINPSISNIYSDFKKHIEKSVVIDFENIHYNLVYGGLGKLVCLMEYYKATGRYNKKLLNTISELLIKHIAITPHGFAWINKYYLHEKNKSNEINISMAQGIAGIIMGLTIIFPYTKTEIKTKIKEVLYESFKFIKAIELQQFDRCKKIPTHFYSNEEKYIHFNRIGWAFGDISIALAIYNSGQAIKNKEMCLHSINILKQISKLTNENSKYCLDGTVSQGTSGVAHIFNRMYKLTGIKEFDTARWYWANETLNMAKYNDGLANYKFWVNKEIGLKNDVGFYEGISGVGLVLLGFLTDDIKDISWDRCLLLN